MVACPPLHVCLTLAAGWISRVVQALASIVSDGRLLMMVLVQALFEGSMLAFIIVWVPALKASTVSCIFIVFARFFRAIIVVGTATYK